MKILAFVLFGIAVAFAKCPPNQKLLRTNHGFIETCENPKKPIWWNNDSPSSKRCLCKKGYTFKTSEYKKCIPLEDCGKDCPPNTEFVMSYGGFRPTCAEPKRPKDTIDAYPPHKECLCKKGYVYETEENEKCIPLKNCRKSRT